MRSKPIILLETGPTDWERAESELNGFELGEMMSTAGYAYRGRPFGIDNGAFSNFNPQQFRNQLKRLKPYQDKCLFVAAPDVVGSAMRTSEAFSYWLGELHGWPIALVAQDGIENVPIDWRLIDAIFIGGTNEFKLGIYAQHVIRCAQVQEKWVHVGRVNTPDRYEYFAKPGVDSIDGVGLSRYTWMRENIAKSKPLLDIAKEIA